MRGGKSEEPRKTDGFNTGVLRLQRATEHLGPDVDAKGRLNIRPPFDKSWFLPGHQTRQFTLFRPLGGFLQHGVDDQVAGRG